jgi:protease-4
MQPTSRRDLRIGLLAAWLAVAAPLAGCHEIPIHGLIHTDSKVAGAFDARLAGAVDAKVDVRLSPLPDPGPMVPVVVRSSPGGPAAPRVALVDVDGLLLNQNLTGLYSVGENPISAFREKLEAAAGDPLVRAVVVRINSPGGGVTATDILAEELRRFRETTRKPAVACLMDVATSGAYYLAVGCDRVVAHPTTITGGIGAIINHYNLQDAMGQLNLRAEPIKAGNLVDMGSVLEPLSDESRALLQGMTDSFRDRFQARIAQRRPGLTAKDRKTLGDGRIVAAPQALALHLVDRLGYVDDAIAEAEQLAGTTGSEVVLFQRSGYPTHSIYAITPNIPLQGELLPFSYPGLDRSKLPTFLYLWQPDPTISRLGGH